MGRPQIIMANLYLQQYLFINAARVDSLILTQLIAKKRTNLENSYPAKSHQDYYQSPQNAPDMPKKKQFNFLIQVHHHHFYLVFPKISPARIAKYSLASFSDISRK